MNPARFLLAPWWTFQLGTGAKAFSDNPILGSPALNRHGLHQSRVRLAATMAARRRRSLARLVSPADRAAFDRDGFVECRDFLPAPAFDRLRRAALAYQGPAREMVQGDTVTRRLAVERATLAAVPELRTLLDDGRWRGLLRYAGSHDAEPLVYLQTILSGVHDAPGDPQTALHADTFHATVKAWFFLTDVGADEGAFTYVPGSHRATPARLEWERTRSVAAAGLDRLSQRGSLRIDADELPALGLPVPQLFAVPANTLIVADTHGFHARGPSLRPSIRVEVWAYGRSNPFSPVTGLDLARRLGVADRRIGWAWRARDRFERLLGQPWRDVGPKRPGDPA